MTDVIIIVSEEIRDDLDLLKDNEDTKTYSAVIHRLLESYGLYDFKGGVER